MIVQDKPRDPRTYKEPPKGAPAPKKTGVPELRCTWAVCNTQIDATYVAPEQVANFARVHGFVEADDGDGKLALFCCKRCSILHQQASERAKKLMDLTPKPTAPVMGKPPTAVHVETATDRNGDSVYSAKCGRWMCGVRFEVAARSSQEDALRAAVGHGFVETPDGLFCSHQCARKCRGEIGAGMQENPHPAPVVAPAPKPESKAERVTTPPTASELAALLASVVQPAKQEPLPAASKNPNQQERRR